MRILSVVVRGGGSRPSGSRLFHGQLALPSPVRLPTLQWVHLYPVERRSVSRAATPPPPSAGWATPCWHVCQLARPPAGAAAAVDTGGDPVFSVPWGIQEAGRLCASLGAGACAASWERCEVLGGWLGT